MTEAASQEVERGSMIVKSPVKLTPFTIGKKKKAEQISRLRMSVADSQNPKGISKGLSSPLKLRMGAQFNEHISIDMIDQSLVSLNGKYDKLLSEYESSFDSLPEDKRLAFLSSENKQLRDELKRLNKFLTYLVEHRKNSLSKKPKQKIVIPVGQPKELLEQQLEEIESEYKVCAERIEVLSNPNYVNDLKERIVTLELKIKKMGKNKKNMEVSQKKNANIIQKVEGDESEIAHDFKSIKKMVGDTGVKIKDLEVILDKHAKTLQDNTTKTQERTEQYKKLSQEAKDLGIDIKGDNKDGKAEEYEKLGTKKETLSKTSNLVKTRHNVTLGEYNQKFSKLQKELSEVSEAVEQKQSLLMKKQEELNMLMNQMGDNREAIEAAIQKLDQNAQSRIDNKKLKNMNSIEKPESEEYDNVLENVKQKEQESVKKIQQNWKKHKEQKKVQEDSENFNKNGDNENAEEGAIEEVNVE